MTFIIHYLVRTAMSPLHFNIVSNHPVNRKNLDSLYEVLTRDAQTKIGYTHNIVVGADDIVIANIIPIPDGSEAYRPFADTTRRHVPPPERQPASEIGGS